MSTLYLILLIVAAVCFLLAAAQATILPRVSWVGLGLLAWVLVPLLQRIHGL